MTNSSPRLSIRDDRLLDPSILEVLVAVNGALMKAACPYILVGAMARDLLLTHVFGLPAYRATQDLDFGVAVESWDRFDAVKHAILALGLEQHPKIAHRFLSRRPGGEHAVPVDIIPFGDVATPEGKLAWPPAGDFILTVAGFAEALATAAQVQVASNLVVPVASLAGLAVLKLFAWRDRQANSDKDAADLYRVMASYADAGNEHRLYSDELHALEAANFDFPAAGARLLGHDARRLCSRSTREMLAALLADAAAMERLTEQLASQGGREEDAYFDAAARYLAEFRDGFARL